MGGWVGGEELGKQLSFVIFIYACMFGVALINFLGRHVDQH